MLRTSAPRSLPGGLITRIGAALPRGGALSRREWERRHTALRRLLVAHAAILFVVATAQTGRPALAALQVSPLAALGAVAGLRRAGPRVRSCAVGAGLATASGLVVHLTGGTIEGHFHFFVVIGLLSLYQDWVPFGTTIAVVVAHHGVIGTIAPGDVYNHPAAIERPWLYAAIHGGWLLVSAAAGVIAWRLNERHLLHDSLTGLPNRTYLQHLLLEVSQATLVKIDVDGLDAVSERFGDDAADSVIVEVSVRIADVFAGRALVTRPTIDGFAALVTGEYAPEEIDAMVAALQRSLSGPYALEGGLVAVPVSMGMATGAMGSEPPAAVLHHADLAARAARRSGGGSCVTFEPWMHADVEARRRLEADLVVAVERGELEVHYQPVVDLRGGRMSGVEALVRWRHPDRGLLEPAVFLPVLEEIGLLPALTQLVLDEACRFAVARHSEHPGEAPLTVAVNVSPRNLATEDLATSVGRALAASGLDPALLTLEVTETSVLRDLDAVVPMLKAVRAAGVSIAVDDFGTGFSSLSHLKHLPVDIVKIDRSFVDGLATELEDSTVVAAVLNLAHTLSLSVVAEGVESAKQLRALRELGCEYAQGYLFSQAVPGAEVPAPEWMERIMAGLGIVEEGTTDAPRFSVVIADDVDDERRLLRRALERSGRFTVAAEAIDGIEAVSLASALRPDLVLLDLDMPRLDGMTALALIAVATPATRIVVLSGYTNDLVLAGALERGATACLPKGFGDVATQLLEILEVPAWSP